MLTDIFYSNHRNSAHSNDCNLIYFLCKIRNCGHGNNSLATIELFLNLQIKELNSESVKAEKFGSKGFKYNK